MIESDEKPIFNPHMVVMDNNNSKLFGFTIKSECDHKALVIVEIYKRHRRNEILNYFKMMKRDLKEIEFNFVDVKELYEQAQLNKIDTKEFVELTDMITKEFIPVECKMHKMW